MPPTIRDSMNVDTRDETCFIANKFLYILANIFLWSNRRRWLVTFFYSSVWWGHLKLPNRWWKFFEIFISISNVICLGKDISNLKFHPFYTLINRQDLVSNIFFVINEIVTEPNWWTFPVVISQQRRQKKSKWNNLSPTLFALHVWDTQSHTELLLQPNLTSQAWGQLIWRLFSAWQKETLEEVEID